MFTEALLGNTADRCLLQHCVATSTVQLGLALHGTEKTPLSLLFHNYRVYRFLWLKDYCMAQIDYNTYALSANQAAIKAPGNCQIWYSQSGTAINQ
jgi:hypothetical protein